MTFAVKGLFKIWLLCGKMKGYLISVANIALLWSVPQLAVAQERFMSDCFSALKIEVPFLSALPKTARLDSSDVTVVNYLVEDQYTFWYQISSATSDTLHYSVWASDTTDVFKTMLYQSNDSAFCQQLVSGNISAEQVFQSHVVLQGQSGQVNANEYQVALRANNKYFLSVLAMSEEFCGHSLELLFQGERIRFHAVNKPCFDFATIGFRDHPQTDLDHELDTQLQLSLDSEADLPQLADSISLQQQNNVESVQNAPDQEQKVETIDEDFTRMDRKNSPEFGFAESHLAEMDLEVGNRLSLKQVFFHNNTYAFRDGSETQLKELLELMTEHSHLKIEVGGHTSGNTKNIRPDRFFRNHGKAWNFKGSALKLSEMRAEAVKNYLVDHGIDKNRVTTVGYGDSEKVVENAQTPDEHRQNMRVEIKIISTQ